MAHETLDDLRKRWDGFAEADPMFYIATRSKSWTPEEFFASGRPLVDLVMKWIGSEGRRDAMLEIGCGLGRTAVHFARHFHHVEAIDISAAMIERARSLSPPDNLRYSQSCGIDLREFEDDRFNLVASFLVFQHIEDESIIAGYLREIARVLHSDGRAVLQFDTRRSGLAQRLYQSLPDALLPRAHRRGIRRHRRDAGRLRGLIRESGLAIVDERQPASADHLFLLAVAPPAHRTGSRPG